LKLNECGGDVDVPQRGRLGYRYDVAGNRTSETASVVAE
jgi:hypothetical protein